jgi:hypothetical protein
VTQATDSNRRAAEGILQIGEDSLFRREEARLRAAVREALDVRDMEWREALWIGHTPDTMGLYGDDGERQCNNLGLCGGYCDFKRQPIADLIAHVRQSLKRQAEDAQRATIRGRRFVDMTPDGMLAQRILEEYVDDSEWNDNTLGLPPENPLCVAMNEAQRKRNELLRAAIGRLAEPERGA